MTAIVSPKLALADVIKCSFTEPFVTTYYDTGRETLTIKGDAGGSPAVQRGLSLHILAAGVLEIRDAANVVVQHYELNSNGQDGMGDGIYPYDVLWPARKLRGGCTSGHLPMVSDR